MEIQGTDGSTTHLNPNTPTFFGRENGLHPNDLTISRRHISFELNNQTSPRVSFEVVGKNPIWVYTKEDGKVEIFKRFQRGILGINDKFCVSAKNPVWFTIKREEEKVEIDDDLSQSLEISSGFEEGGDFDFHSVDISNFDPVQEFGFLVIGHEFDQYQKQMIRDIKKWNWFLEDPKREGDDEEVEDKKGKRGGGRKRKKSSDDDVNEEWTSESEDEEAVTTKARKVQIPKYQTRSKYPIRKDGKSTKKTSNKDKEEEEEYEDEEEEDEEDETLGGFIVDEDTVEEEDDDDGQDVVDEEEEEFVEDELED